MSYSLGMWHQHITQFLAQIYFFHSPISQRLWKTLSVVIRSACLALPSSNVVCFLFLQNLRELISWLECYHQLFIWRNASFFAPTADVAPGSRLVQDRVTYQVQSFTCCVDKCCLSTQTRVVFEESRGESPYGSCKAWPQTQPLNLSQTHTLIFYAVLSSQEECYRLTQRK